MTAPERIFASKSTNGVCVICFSTKSDEYVTQYARADLHDATKVQLAECEARLRKAVEALRSCVSILNATVEESGRSIEWGEEDPFRMGEWFDENDIAYILSARAVLAEIEKGGV